MEIIELRIHLPLNKGKVATLLERQYLANIARALIFSYYADCDQDIINLTYLN